MITAAMEYLVAAVILYFILQTAGNLVLILRGRDASARDDEPSHPWRGPSPRKHTGQARSHPTFWGEDVREARWEDVDES